MQRSIISIHSSTYRLRRKWWCLIVYIVINQFSLIICSFLHAMAKYKITTGIWSCVKSPHTYAITFFLVHSRASIDDDAIVEKLIRSDGNSRSYICHSRHMYMHTYTWHIREAAYIFSPSIYTRTEKYGTRWDLMNTMYQFWRFLSSCIKLPKRQLFLHFMILSKYLHIIYDGKYWWSNMFAAKEMKEKYRYFEVDIYQNICFFFLISWYFGLKYVKSIIIYSLLKTCVFNMGAFRSSQAISFVI